MSGLRSSTSGVYNNGINRRTTICNDVIPLNSHFQKNGYFVAGAGKIYHGDSDQFGQVIPARLVEIRGEYQARRNVDAGRIDVFRQDHPAHEVDGLQRFEIDRGRRLSGLLTDAEADAFEEGSQRGFASGLDLNDGRERPLLGHD